MPYHTAKLADAPLTVSAQVIHATGNANEKTIQYATQFRISNPSSAVASFAVLTLGVGWRNALSMNSNTEWRYVEATDQVKVVRLVLASGSSRNWSPVTPGFTLITEEVSVRTIQLEQDTQNTRAIGLLRLDHDGGSRLYGISMKPNVATAAQLFLVPYDESMAGNGYLSDVEAFSLFQPQTAQL